MGFYIPETMKRLDNWVVWRKEGEGHYKKVPYDPRTGRRANPTKGCCNYDDASAYYEYSGKYDGIGFVFTNECGLTFIDLDNCINEDGTESALAQEMQELFKDCYIELSQSERGLHIVCAGTVPRTIKTKEIEVYSNARYMAMTGNAINAQEPHRAQKQLDLIFDRFAAEKAENEPYSAPQGHIYECTIDAAALIEVISHSKQGAKWKKLHEGDITGYPSRSEAVLAYTAITNYYAGGRPELVKAVFAQSGFPVDDTKYKKEYYINRAIQKAQEPFVTAKGIMSRSAATDHTERRRRRF